MTGMLALTPAEIDALGPLVAAGDDGVLLGPEMKLSAAVRLEMAGYATIKNGDRMRATVTPAGKSFHRRAAGR